MSKDQGSIWNFPIRNMTVLHGSLNFSGDHAFLVTDPRLWAWSAQAQFELPGIDDNSCAIEIALEVERGTVAVGWLDANEKYWVVQTSAGPHVGSVVLRLLVPAGTIGGKLVFANWTEGDNSAVARVTGINILSLQNAKLEFLAALAAEENGNPEAAIEHYRAALRTDPSHVESIAGLGRLRFNPPPQPILEEMKRRSPSGDHCEVVIAIRNPCNYRCFYCCASDRNNTPVKPLDFQRIKSHYDSLGCPSISTSFDCGGGEPTVHPQFGDALRLSGQYGPIDFPTNNSQNPRRWLPRELAHRLSIRAALHPEGEAKLQQYLDNAIFLLDAGCRIRCDFIAHPTRLSDVDRFGEIFANVGVPFIAIPFIGTFNGASYPHAFTEDEKRILERHAPRNATWGTYVKISSAVTRIRNFRGISCLSGRNYVQIDENGQMHRCCYDPDPIQARLKRPAPCGVKHCGCGIPLEHLSFAQTGFWPRLDELDMLAQSLGYESAEDGVAAEYMHMYDTLMSAYGKDEFPE